MAQTIAVFVILAAAAAYLTLALIRAIRRRGLGCACARRGGECPALKMMMRMDEDKGDGDTRSPAARG